MNVEMALGEVVVVVTGGSVGAPVVEDTTKTAPITLVSVSRNGYAPRSWKVNANSGTVSDVMWPELNRGGGSTELPLKFSETIECTD